MNSQVAIKLDAFFTKFKRQTYRKGEILIRADENPLGIFYLKNGRVKNYIISKKGEEVILNIFKPISFFPMSWAVNQTENIYYYEAMTDIEVWRAPKDETVGFIKNNTDVLYDLVKRIYLGMDGLLMRMSYLMSGTAYERLIGEIIILARRFGEMDKKTGRISINIKEKDIAAESGMSRETVSRTMKILKDKKLTVYKSNQLIVESIKSLEEELGNY